MSQPTVTTQVGQLEALYKVELFTAPAAACSPTEMGERLVICSPDLRPGGRSHSAAAVRGELRSGHCAWRQSGPPTSRAMLVAFHQRSPGIKVSVSTGNSQAVLDRPVGLHRRCGRAGAGGKRRALRVHALQRACGDDLLFGQSTALRNGAASASPELQGRGLILLANRGPPRARPSRRPWKRRVSHA